MTDALKTRISETISSNRIMLFMKGNPAMPQCGFSAAVVGILGTANIPIVHFSVKWWRALHQPATILGPEPSPIAAPIALTLFVNWLAFTLLFLYLLAKRTEIARLEERHAE